MILTNEEIMQINQTADFDSALGYARKIEQAVLESYKAELLKEAGDPVLYAEFAEDGGWLCDASEYQDHLEEPHALYTSDQLVAAVLKATKPLEGKLAAAQEENGRLENQVLARDAELWGRTQEILGLKEQLAAEQLNNKRLRDALQAYIDDHEECQDADDWMAMMCSMEAHHAADEALAAGWKAAIECVKREAFDYWNAARREDV